MQQLRFLIHVVVLVVCDRYNLSWYEEGALLDDLPQPTKQAVLRENCGTMLQSMPLFVSAHMVRQAVWSFFVARLVRDGGLLHVPGSHAIVKWQSLVVPVNAVKQGRMMVMMLLCCCRYARSARRCVMTQATVGDRLRGCIACIYRVF